MKFADIKGTQVIGLADASKLGYVDSLLLNLPERRVLGLRIRSGGLLTHHEGCLLRDIKSFGQDAVTVEDASKLNGEDKFAEFQGNTPLDKVIGARIFDEAGTDLGKIADIQFDPQTGTISTYVLTPGLLDRIKRDEHVMPADAMQSFGEGRMVVSAASAADSDAPAESTLD